MAREWSAGSDRGLGLATAAVALALVGTGGMVAGAAQPLAGVGFAVAMVAAAAGIVALHAFPT